MGYVGRGGARCRSGIACGEAWAIQKEGGIVRRLSAIASLAMLCGCAIAPATPEERAAAICLRDTLLQSPWIVSASVVESAHRTMIVRFEIRYLGGRTEAGTLVIQQNEPNAPPLAFSNSLGGFPTDFGIDKLLRERCPTVRDWTLQV